MKKKQMLGAMASTLTISALLTFNFLIFPDVLAKTPNSGEIETITSESVFPTENSEQRNIDEQLAESEVIDSSNASAETPSASKDASNINAITKEQALKTANREFKNKELTIGGYTINDLSNLPVTAVYITENEPFKNPVWAVIYMYQVETGMKMIWSQEDIDLGLSIGKLTKDDLTNWLQKDNLGNWYTISKKSHFIQVNIDAFSGEYLNWVSANNYGEKWPDNLDFINEISDTD